MMFHPRTTTLSRYLDGELEASRDARLKKHLAGCSDCRQRLAVLRAAGRALSPGGDQAARLDTVTANVMDYVRNHPCDAHVPNRSQSSSHEDIAMPTETPKFHIPRWGWATAAMTLCVAALSVPTYLKYNEEQPAKINRVKSGQRSMASAMERYYIEMADSGSLADLGQGPLPPAPSAAKDVKKVRNENKRETATASAKLHSPRTGTINSSGYRMEDGVLSPIQSDLSVAEPMENGHLHSVDSYSGSITNKATMNSDAPLELCVSEESLGSDQLKTSRSNQAAPVISGAPSTVIAGDSEGNIASDFAFSVVTDADGDGKAKFLFLEETKPAELASREAYDAIAENRFLDSMSNPLSTFSIDVDTASYSNLRRMLEAGQRPPAGAVRIEELLNYFHYNYPVPTGTDPFSVDIEIGACPWKSGHRLARIGLKGKEIDWTARPDANLVFLIDVSGSMQDANKIPLVIESMKLMAANLGGGDRVAIAVYAGSSGLALDSTPCSDLAAVFASLENLQAGGSTNGGEGIQLAYKVAQDNFIEGGINRVILATDGDFNVGTTSQSDLVSLIEEKAKTGVFLSVLGFGMGNYQDSMLEKLADKGNGNYAYIDTEREAQKALVEQIGGTLVTIAKDVKIQVEFNPAEVAGYRLIGYENRMLAKEDFNDDTKDAGEIGAGLTVTALYEIVPIGAPVPDDMKRGEVEPLRYQVNAPASGAPAAELGTALSEAAVSGEAMTVKLRYKEPDGDTSKLLEFTASDSGANLEASSEDFRFAASVAEFGLLMRNSKYKGSSTFADALELAQSSVGTDALGYRTEFSGLIEKAQAIHGETATGE